MPVSLKKTKEAVKLVRLESLKALEDNFKGWMCIQLLNPHSKAPKTWYNYATFSYNRRASIQKLLGGGSMTWKEAKKYGWMCKKVNLKTTVL